MKRWRIIVVAMTMLGCFGAPSLSEARASTVRQLLHGHVPAAVAGLTPVSRLEATQHLDLAISLPLRNHDVLTNLLQQMYDPASPAYRQFLSVSNFTEMCGPTEADYEAVAQFAEAHGLRVTSRHGNRTLLNVNGAVADIERTFGVKLQRYQHPTKARTFYAPDAEPSLDLSTPVLEITGLDDYAPPRPASVHQGQRATMPTSLVTKQPSGILGYGTPQPLAGSAGSGNYMGNDFRAAYAPGVTLTGAGQKIGLAEFSDYYTNDILNYEARTGRTNIVTAVLIDGRTGIPATNSSTTEISLDIEMAVSMAPGAQIISYQGVSSADVLSRMAADNSCKELSCSWNFTVGASQAQSIEEFAAQGQTFFMASGDGGAELSGILGPEDYPYLTSVGGTTLSTTGPAGSWVGEKVWNWDVTGATGSKNGSGGGASTKYDIPVWQQSINMTTNHGSTTMRNIPDVAIVAEQLFLVDNNGETWVNIGGTSAAAPLWAAFMSLVNQQAAANGQAYIGFANPALYAIGSSPAYSACFHDVITGNNTNASSPSNYWAVPGYDLCTGWGSPTGSNLINALLQSTPYALSLRNGSFETGSFLDWTLTGNATANIVSSSSTYFHGGFYGARMGGSGSLSYLSQSLATAPGQQYLLSFWLNNAAGGTPNEFQVSWNGTNIFDKVNFPATSWTNMQFKVYASGPSTTLQFGFRNDTTYFGLDNIGVQAMLTPPALSGALAASGTNGFALTWSAVQGAKYFVQYKNDLSAATWNTLSTNIATNITMTFMDNSGSVSQRFYRLALASP